MAISSERPLALVTGASSGIGYELARLFAADGHDLIITATSHEGLERTVEAVCVCHGRGYADRGYADRGRRPDPLRWRRIPPCGNQGNRAALAAAALNAGVGLGGYFIGGTELDAELNLIQLNVVSQVHLTKRILPDMAAQGSGKLLYTASISGTMPTPYEAVYGGSKTFLISFAEAVKSELKDSGVTIKD